MGKVASQLSAEKALIWRILHRNNLPWVLDHGIHSRNSPHQDPDYLNIGNVELIDKRSRRTVPIAPGGTLSDYVPFYFTPFSPMLLNIKTGYNGITKRSNEEIVILVSSLRRVHELGRQFVFTDRHAYQQLANFYSDLEHLDAVDWELLRSRDFKYDPEDLLKMDRYQAEALVHSHLPIEGLRGIVCYSVDMKGKVEELCKQRSLALKVHAAPECYF